MKFSFKKIELLAYHREKTEITSMLQELGVIHLELDTDFRNEQIEDLEIRKTRLTRAIEFIQEYADSTTGVAGKSPSAKMPVEEVLDKILELKHQKELVNQEEEVLNKYNLKLKPWGDFDAEKVSRLLQANIQLTFYIAKKKEFKEYDFTSLIHQVIYEGPDDIYFVVVSKDEHPSLPFEAVQLPSISKLELQSREAKLKKSKEDLKKTIPDFFPYLPILKKELVELENQWQLHLANGSYDEYSEGSILHLKGWFPANMEDRLRHYIDKKNWSYVISDPLPDDEVPVLLNNPEYPKLFESITKIFQLPGYYEMDLTPFIAVFYPILFAYCLGDAGYGLVLLLAALIGWFTFLRSSRRMAGLGVILGAFTTLMGVVKSGSIFGIPIVAQSPNALLEYLSQYVVIPDDRGVVFNAFNVALMIGVVQILSGIIISIVNKIRYKSFVASLSQIGKLFMVVGLIWMFLAEMQEVAAFQPYPGLRRAALVVGVLLVLFFHDLKASIISRAATGILPLFFILTGILGDVLSYVRLFALGVASSVLGLVVNQIGMQIMGDTWWGWILGVIFLIFGHSLNFALATLGAFVHPLRLTFVEFYNNAQFEGGGIAYKPLKKINVLQSK